MRAIKPGPARLLGRGLLLIIVLIVAYLLFWPSPIDPCLTSRRRFRSSREPPERNDRLASAELIAVGKVEGPEDVEVDAREDLHRTGRWPRGSVDPDETVTSLANTGGRPVGIAFAPDGKLIVADAVKGLLSIDPVGEVTLLADGAGSEPLGFADDVTVAQDGTIYFSDASTKFGPQEYLYDMLEARPHGRLVRYDPATHDTTVLLPDMCFANGVALSKNEDFLLVNETYRFSHLALLVERRAGRRVGRVYRKPARLSGQYHAERPRHVLAGAFHGAQQASGLAFAASFHQRSAGKAAGFSVAATAAVRLRRAT